ncbi:MAG: histidine triad nucleotide-binding protein [Chitinispirillales bacterium]|jgi:histidine triad (HIT) family protein|nr:histidine triad nucleotide-binding protein [Chitinispirillales bacterium]
MSDCLFCKIAAGQIPADKIFEDDCALVFRDISPQAPTHLLAIPKKHYPSVHEIPPDEVGTLLGKLMTAVTTALRKTDLDKNGYRLVVNSGEIAGQTVPHLHIHVLGGRSLAWPPG